MKTKNSYDLQRKNIEENKQATSGLAKKNSRIQQGIIGKRVLEKGFYLANLAKLGAMGI